MFVPVNQNRLLARNRTRLDIQTQNEIYCIFGVFCEKSNTVSSDSDQRSNPRALIELKVEYRRLNTFFADYTRNISRGGTFIKTKKPLDIDTEFLFKLQIPTLEEPIVLKGKVQWVITPEQATDDTPPGMGIKFLYEEGIRRDDIETKVERLMIDSLGNHVYNKLIRQHSKTPSS